MCETVVLLTHDLRTDASIGKQRKPTQTVVLIFGSHKLTTFEPKYHCIRHKSWKLWIC